MTKKREKQMGQRLPREESGLEKAAERAKELMGGMAGMATAETAGATDLESFITQAAIGDLYECEAARLALERSQSETVRMIAAHMLDDHTTSTHQLQSTLRSMPDASPPPMELDDKHQKLLEKLEDASDKDFDQRYLKQQTAAHREAIALFEGYVSRGDHPALRLFALGGAPVLRRHLAMVEAAEQSLSDQGAA